MGEGVRQKWTNADRGRGWLVKCGRPLGKKIIATIFDGQPNVDRSGQREGVPKNFQICADILYGCPHSWICLGNNDDTYSKFRRKLKCVRDTFSVQHSINKLADFLDELQFNCLRSF